MKIDYTDVPRLLDAVDEAGDAMRGARLGLERLAGALAMVGNAILAEKLYDIADSLERPAENLRLSYSRDLGEQCSHSKAIAGGMLELAIHGCLTPAKQDSTTHQEKD